MLAKYIFDFILKRKENIENIFLLLLLFASVFSFISFYTLSANMHGDGVLHAYYAKLILKKQSLIKFDEYQIIDIFNGEKIFDPIQYPLTSYLIIAFFQLVGGSNFLQFFPAFFGSFIAIFTYLLLRNINKCIGILSGFFVIVLNYYRFVSIYPSLEEVFLIAMLGGTYYYYKLLKTGKLSYGFLTGIFLGFGMSIKQQGIIFFMTLLIYSVLVTLYRFGYHLRRGKNMKGKKYDWTRCFLIVIITALLVSFLPLWDQMLRNGTLGSTLDERFQWLQSKYHIYPESRELYLKKVTWIRYPEVSILDSIMSFVLYAVYYGSKKLFFPLQMKDLVLTITILAFSCLYLYRKDRVLFPILFFLFLSEVFTHFMLKMPINQYHVLGLSVSAIFTVTCIVSIGNFARRYTSSAIPMFLIVVIIIPLQSSFITYVHPTYGYSGRYTDAYLNAYEELGNFIKKTPKSAIFLTPSLVPRENERMTIWPESYNSPPKLYKLFFSSNITEIMEILHSFNVSYILIEERTIGKGTGDGWPRSGILKFLNTSSYFEEVYRIHVDKNKKEKGNYWEVEGDIIIYKVIYDLNDLRVER